METIEYKSQKITRLRVLQTILEALTDAIVSKEAFDYSSDHQIIKNAVYMISYPTTNTTLNMISEFKLDTSKIFKRKFVAYELYEIFHSINMNAHKMFIVSLRCYLNSGHEYYFPVDRYKDLEAICTRLLTVLKQEIRNTIKFN